MQIIEMQLNKFFIDYEKPYKANGIEMIYSPDGTIQLCCKVPGLIIKKEYILVDLISDHEDLYDFIYEYLITQLDDLDKLTPELMLKRFLVGRCDLYVYLDPDMEY